MSKRRDRNLFMLLGSVLTLGVLVLFYWRFSRTAAATALTNMRLCTYQMATTNFFAVAGRWPTSATELVSNSMGLVFIYPSPPARDGWGRQIVYEPYSSNAGYGKVVSYGRDGRPGGTGADADIEVRFP